MKQKGSIQKEPKCGMCGECCRGTGFALTITAEDWRRWIKEGREDILQYVRPSGITGKRFIESSQKNRVEGSWIPGDIWVHPKTGHNLNKCPFLRRVSQGKYACTIHNTRPEICREFWCDYAYGVGKKGECKRWPDYPDID